MTTPRNGSRNGGRDLPTHAPSGEKIVTYKGQRYTETGLALVKQTEAEERAKRGQPDPVVQVQEFSETRSDNTQEAAAKRVAEERKREARRNSREEAKELHYLEAELARAIERGDLTRVNELRDRVGELRSSAIDLPAALAAIDARLQEELGRATDTATNSWSDRDLAGMIRMTGDAIRQPVQLTGLESRGQLEALYATLQAAREQYGAEKPDTAAFDEGLRWLRAENQVRASQAARDRAAYEEWAAQQQELDAQQAKRDARIAGDYPLQRRIQAAREKHGLPAGTTFFYEDTTKTLWAQTPASGDAPDEYEYGKLLLVDGELPPPPFYEPAFHPQNHVLGWDNAIELGDPIDPAFLPQPLYESGFDTAVPGWDDAIELGETPDSQYTADAGMADELELRGLGGDPLLPHYYSTQDYQRNTARLAAFEAGLTHLGGNIYRAADGQLYRRDSDAYRPVVQNLYYDPESAAPAFLDVAGALGQSQAEHLRASAIAAALQEARDWQAVTAATLASPATSGVHGTDAAQQTYAAQLQRMANIHRVFSGRDGSSVLTREEADELTNKIADWIEGDVARLVAGAERVQQSPAHVRRNGVLWRLADGSTISAAEYQRLREAAEERATQAEFLRAVRDGRWEIANAAVLVQQGGAARWQLPDGTLMSRQDFAQAYGPFRRDTSKISASDYLAQGYGHVGSALYSGLQTVAALARGDTSRTVPDLHVQHGQYTADRQAYFNRLQTAPWYDWAGWLPGAGSFAATYGDGQIRGWEHLGVGLDALDLAGGPVLGAAGRGVRVPVRVFTPGVRQGSPGARIGAAWGQIGPGMATLRNRVADFHNSMRRFDPDPATGLLVPPRLTLAKRMERWKVGDDAYGKALDDWMAAINWNRRSPDNPLSGFTARDFPSQRRYAQMMRERALNQWDYNQMTRSQLFRPVQPLAFVDAPWKGVTRRGRDPLSIQALDDERLLGEHRAEFYIRDARPFYVVDRGASPEVILQRTTRRPGPARIEVGEDDVFRGGDDGGSGVMPPRTPTEELLGRMPTIQETPLDAARRVLRNLRDDDPFRARGALPAAVPTVFPVPVTPPIISLANASLQRPGVGAEPSTGDEAQYHGIGDDFLLLAPATQPGFAPVTQPAIVPVRVIPRVAPTTQPPPFDLPSRFPFMVPSIWPGPGAWPGPGSQSWITTWTVPSWSWEPVPALQPAPGPKPPVPVPQPVLQLQTPEGLPVPFTRRDPMLTETWIEEQPDPLRLPPPGPVRRWEMDPSSLPPPLTPTPSPRTTEETRRPRPPFDFPQAERIRHGGQHAEWVRATERGIEHTVNLVTGEHLRRRSPVEYAPFEILSRSSKRPRRRTVRTRAGALVFTRDGVEVVNVPAARPRPRGPLPRKLRTR